VTAVGENNNSPSLSPEQHLAKIVRLMNVTAQREFDKMLRRIERRKVRVPEILELLKTAKPRQAKKLEDELRILMRKSERDNFMLQQAMLAAADSARLEAVARAEANRDSSSKRSLNRVKKHASKQAREIGAELESASQTSFVSTRAVQQVLIADSGEKKRLAKESGYSSNDFDESTHEFTSPATMDASIGEEEEAEVTTRIDEIPRRPLYRPVSSDSHLNDTSIGDTSIYRAIEPSVGTAQTYGRRCAGEQSFGARSGNNSMNASNGRGQSGRNL